MIRLQSDELLSGILRTLRGTLNACPEIAGEEEVTANVIASFLQSYNPNALLTELGGHGVAAVFKGKTPGKTVLFRCELDALATQEGETGYTNDAPLHLCGHDGHMAMVAGLAPLLSQDPPEAGNVVLLFQPAEETGEGAQRVIADPRFPSIQPDIAIGLHNIPGQPQNTILYKTGAFSSASTGMKAELRGIPSHAAEPEKARSPAQVLSKLLAQIPDMGKPEDKPYTMITVTHAQMGRESFGTTPGAASLCATLRSDSSAALQVLSQEVERRIHTLANEDELYSEVSWHDIFPEILNDTALVNTLTTCCEHGGLSMIELDKPYRWSEDFAYFAEICPILFFGLGIGEQAPRLHQPNYRFPDHVLDTGLKVYDLLVKALCV